MTELLINGNPGACVSAFDRGLQFGDGLFETIAARERRPCLLAMHLDRLYSDCRRLSLIPPDRITLEQEINRLAAIRQDGVIKLIVTRGESDRGYAYPAKQSSNRYLYLHQWPQHLEDLSYNSGIHLTVCGHPLSENPGLAGIKHLNRLDQVIGRNEWQDPAIHEGLMLDSAGSVIEGTMSNLFLVRAGRLYTPGLDRSGVAGIVRQLVIDQAESMGEPVVETRLTLDDLQQAEALYICNSLLGVLPVKRLRNREWVSTDWQHPAILAARERVFQER